MDNIKKLRAEQLINIELKNGGIANLQLQAEAEMAKAKGILKLIKLHNEVGHQTESTKKFVINLKNRLNEVVEIYNILIEAIEKNA